MNEQKFWDKYNHGIKEDFLTWYFNISDEDEEISGEYYDALEADIKLAKDKVLSDELEKIDAVLISYNFSVVEVDMGKSVFKRQYNTPDNSIKLYINKHNGIFYYDDANGYKIDIETITKHPKLAIYFRKFKIDEM